MIYKSKIAWWMYFTAAITVLPIVFTPWVFLDSKIMGIVFLAVMLPLIWFVIGLMCKTYYSIEGKTLNVKSWFLLNQNIDIMNIISVKETRDPLSAPAMSLDRLKIKAKSTSTLISPALKQEFIAHLLRINPEIKVIYKK